MFKIFDDDNSGSLNEAEFKKGLTEWCRQIDDENQRLNDEQLDEVFRTFDRDGSGTISYNEFLRTLRVRIIQLYTVGSIIMSQFFTENIVYLHLPKLWV